MENAETAPTATVPGPSAALPFVVAVAITKGGTGKTTTASTLAVELARTANGSDGAAVVLIDADTQGQAAHALGVAPPDRGPGLAGVLAGTSTPADALRTVRAAGDGRGPVYLLAGSAALAGEAGKMASDPAAGLLGRARRHARRRRVRRRSRRRDRHAARMGPLSLGALAAADVVLARSRRTRSPLRRWPRSTGT